MTSGVRYLAHHRDFGRDLKFETADDAFGVTRVLIGGMTSGVSTVQRCDLNLGTQIDVLLVQLLNLVPATSAGHKTLSHWIRGTRSPSRPRWGAPQ